MRNIHLLLGTLAVTACSVDHVVVAALDDAGSADSGGTSGRAGSSGLTTSAAGSVTAGGAQSTGGTDRFLLSAGGSNVNVQIGTDAGTTQVLCACQNEPAQLCGIDGVTYPTPCDDGGPCLVPMIACWHACPCVAGEPSTPPVSSWISVDCIPTSPCTGDAMCLTFSNVPPSAQSCPNAGN